MRTSHYSRLKKPTIPLATQGRLPRIYITRTVVPTTTHTHVRLKSIGEKTQRKEEKRKERTEKKRKGSEKEEGRKDKNRRDKKRKQGKEKGKNVILADPRN